MIEFFVPYERIPLDGELQTQALKNWLKLFDIYIDKKRDVLSFLKISMSFITITVITSIIMLMLSNLIFNYKYGLILLALPVWLFVISTLYIGRAIINLVKD